MNSDAKEALEVLTKLIPLGMLDDSTSNMESTTESTESDLGFLLDKFNSDSENEEILSTIYLEPSIIKRQCIRNYFEEIVPSYNNDEFLEKFRITRKLFNTISERFEKSIEYTQLNPEKRFSPSKNIAIFLWFAGHERCSYNELIDRFNISLGTAYRVLDRVIKFLSNLAQEIIVWPDENRKHDISKYFEMRSGFPSVIGVIGMTHIPIYIPKNNKERFINEFGEYSICLQGICDNRGNFLNVCIGHPGSYNANYVLEHSPIYSKLESICGDYYLIADTSYSPQKYLLTSHNEELNLKMTKEEFSKNHNLTKVFIDRTFSLLRRRFQQLNICNLKGVKKINHFVRACCVLHNLASKDDFKVSNDTEGECSIKRVMNKPKPKAVKRKRATKKPNDISL